jgi:hypothetical protein
MATLPAPLESFGFVLGLMASYLALRASCVGFLLLVRGSPAREIADTMAIAAASGLPSTGLIGLAAAIYLIIEG